VQVGNWQLLVERLLKDNIEFFVADTRHLPSNPLLQIRLLPPEPGGFYVRAAHPLPERKPVALKPLWSYGVASVRLPQQVRLTLAGLLGLQSSGAMSLALECDEVQVLKSTTLACDLVLAAASGRRVRGRREVAAPDGGRGPPAAVLAAAARSRVAWAAIGRAALSVQPAAIAASASSKAFAARCSAALAMLR
jgi:hypothetical protein